MDRISITCLLFLVFAGCATNELRRPGRFNLAAHAPGSFVDGNIEIAGSVSLQFEAEEVLERPAILLEDLLQLAEQMNPEIAAARAEIGAASGKLLQARLYPNPTLEFETEDVPAENIGLDRSKNTIAIVQPIILSGRRGAAVTAAAAEADAEYMRLEQKRREVYGKMREVFLELLYLNQAEILYGSLIQDVRQILNVAVVRFEAKAVPELDVLKLEIEMHNLELALRRLAWERKSESQRLDSLLGGLHIPVEKIGGELAADLPQIELNRLLDQIEQHPEAIAGKKEAEAAKQRVRQAKAERLPDVAVRMAYGRDAAEEENVIEAGISIPLPLFDRNQGNIREAESNAQIAEHSVILVVNRIKAQLAAAHADYMAAHEQLLISRDQILPAAEKALMQTREGYRAGKRTLLDQIDAQRVLGEARVSYLAVLREWNLSHARIVSIMDIHFDKPAEEHHE